jgi:hypothetical protein
VDGVGVVKQRGAEEAGKINDSPDEDEEGPAARVGEKRRSLRWALNGGLVRLQVSGLSLETRCAG